MTQPTVFPDAGPPHDLVTSLEGVDRALSALKRFPFRDLVDRVASLDSDAEWVEEMLDPIQEARDALEALAVPLQERYVAALKAALYDAEQHGLDYTRWPLEAWLSRTTGFPHERLAECVVPFLIHTEPEPAWLRRLLNTERMSSGDVWFTAWSRAVTAVPDRAIRWWGRLWAGGWGCGLGRLEALHLRLRVSMWAADRAAEEDAGPGFLVVRRWLVDHGQAERGPEDPGAWNGAVDRSIRGDPDLVAGLAHTVRNRGWEDWAIETGEAATNPPPQSGFTRGSPRTVIRHYLNTCVNDQKPVTFGGFITELRAHGKTDAADCLSAALAEWRLVRLRPDPASSPAHRLRL